MIFCHFWPKMVSKNGQNLAAPQKNRHNLVIFHPISINLVAKVIYSSREIDWRKENDPISFRLDFENFWTKTWAWRDKLAPQTFLVSQISKKFIRHVFLHYLAAIKTVPKAILNKNHFWAPYSPLLLIRGKFNFNYTFKL